jgi:hypothetical protein
MTVADGLQQGNQSVLMEGVGSSLTQPIPSVDDGVGYFAAMGERHRAEMREGRA